MYNVCTQRHRNIKMFRYLHKIWRCARKGLLRILKPSMEKKGFNFNGPCKHVNLLRVPMAKIDPTEGCYYYRYTHKNVYCVDLRRHALCTRGRAGPAGGRRNAYFYNPANANNAADWRSPIN